MSWSFQLYFPLKEGMLQIITLKNPSPQSGLNLWTLGSNDKHANHYTTEATTSSLHSWSRFVFTGFFGYTLSIIVSQRKKSIDAIHK
jgi:hypothetical protein